MAKTATSVRSPVLIIFKMLHKTCMSHGFITKYRMNKMIITRYQSTLSISKNLEVSVRL